MRSIKQVLSSFRFGKTKKSRRTKYKKHKRKNTRRRSMRGG